MKDFIAFRERLRAAGKPPKVVRSALAPKLLVRLNAKARKGPRSFRNPNQILVVVAGAVGKLKKPRLFNFSIARPWPRIPVVRNLTALDLVQVR